MRRIVVILALVGGCALVPAAASGGQLERACRNVYEPNRATLVALGGDPGRDVCRLGADPGKHPTLSAVDRSNRVLEADIAALMPPAASASASRSATSSASTPVNSGGGGGAGGLPACASESGTNYSTGPDNTNPSGATGRYQIMPESHAEICGDLGWSPADQDQCAARIYAQQGSGAWVGCGG